MRAVLLALLACGLVAGPSAHGADGIIPSKITIEHKRVGIIERLRDLRAAKPRPVMVDGATAKKLNATTSAKGNDCPPDNTEAALKRLRILIVEE